MQFKKSLSLLVVLIALAMMAVACGGNSWDDLPDGATVEWDTAVEILNSGAVETAFQTHSLDVTFYLKDGRRIETVEPGIDDIFDAIDACGSPCAGMPIATE